MLYVELDKSDPVIEELLQLLGHKQPKIIAATLSAITAIVHAYGCKTVEPKPIVKILPKAYGHADKNVRAEAQNLTVELYRWLKEGMKPLFWGELKPVQQQDLEKLFEKVKDEPAPKQERLLRSQQAKVEAAAEAGIPEDTGEPEEEEAEADLEPEYMAVNAFEKIPKDFSERLGSAKWKDRKEALDETFTAVNVPAIEDGPFDEIIRGCAKSMKDANIAVVTVAANCVEAIAKGLRHKFSKHKSTILGPMLERFKEKKQSVTDALAAACDALFLSTGLSDILEEILGCLAHKNPQVKLESTKLLTRCLKTTKEAPQLPEVKLIAEEAKKLLGDAQAPTRDAAAEVLGVLWRIMGDRNMLAHIEGLDDSRKTKIKELSDQAEVKAKWKPKAAPPPKPAAAAPAGRKPALGKRPTTGVKKAAPAPQRAMSPEDEPAPLAARPTSRPGTKLAPSKTGLSTPGGGLKKPGLARPGGLPGSTSSPARRPAAPAASEPQEAIPAPRGLPAPGRGLAARPLGRATTPSLEESAPVPYQSSSSAMSHAERAELSDLRSEVELLRSQNSDLRTDKLRLGSQIEELRHQNAQLIEDHTRDMLSVKAKETQLVRARSDVDEAEERISSLSREVDRMKREIQRLGRQNTGHESSAYDQPTSNYGGGYGGESRTNGLNGRYDTTSTSSISRPTYTATNRSMTVPTTPHSALNGSSTPSAELDSEPGKENLPNDDDASGVVPRKEHRLNAPHVGVSADSHHPSYDDTVSSPPIEQSRSYAMGPPASVTAGGGKEAGGNTSATGSMASSRNSSLNRSQSDGVESWRRAAEVTQNLKMRIEMMKVCWQPAIVLCFNLCRSGG